MQKNVLHLVENWHLCRLNSLDPQLNIYTIKKQGLLHTKIHILFLKLAFKIESIEFYIHPNI